MEMKEEMTIFLDLRSHTNRERSHSRFSERNLKLSSSSSRSYGVPHVPDPPAAGYTLTADPAAGVPLPAARSSRFRLREVRIAILLVLTSQVTAPPPGLP